MARSNSPASLERWNNVKDQAPYRASIDNDACWELGRPSHNLAAASKVSASGRLLMAFYMAEMRDYFVEGNLDQGAQSEPDGAENATARRPRPASSNSEQISLQESFSIFTQATQDQNAAKEIIRQVFNREVHRLQAEDRIEEALAIINSMPDCAMKKIAISNLLDSGKWDTAAKPLWKIKSAPYTSDRAAALVIWQRAENAYEQASTTMKARLYHLLEDFLARGDRKGLSDLIDITPASIERAYLLDALRYSMPPEGSDPHP